MLPTQNGTADAHNSSQNSTYYDYYDDYYYYYNSVPTAAASTQENTLKQPHHIATTVMAIVGIVANVFGLIGLSKHKDRQQCTKSRVLLLVSLSTSDIFLCISTAVKNYADISMKLNNVHVTSEITYSCTTTFIDVLIPTGQTISLLNLLGMAIDHWVTFTKPFRYFTVMSKRKTLAMIAFFWFFSFILGLSDYLTGLTALSEGNPIANYCAHISKTIYHPEFTLLVISPFCLIGMTVIYVQIFMVIKKLVDTAPPQQQDFGQAKRALYTTLFILGSFLLCWLPSFTFTITMTIWASLIKKGVVELGILADKDIMQNLRSTSDWLFVLFLLNCVLDPIIYMSHFRMKFTLFCYNLKDKMRRRYSAVGEEHLRPDSMMTVRSSLSTQSPIDPMKEIANHDEKYKLSEENV